MDEFADQSQTLACNAFPEQTEKQCIALGFPEGWCRTVLDQVGEGIGVLAESSLVYANRFLQSLFQQDEKALAQMPFVDCVHPEDRDSFRSYLADETSALPDDVLQGRIFRLLLPERGICPARIRAMPTTWKNGPAILLYISDRSEVHRTEVALQQSQTVQRALLDATDDPVILVDGEGVVQYANRAMAETFGMTPEVLIGHDLKDLLPIDLYTERMTQILGVVSSGDSTIFQDEANDRLYENHAFPIEHVDGRQVAIYARDLTHVKRTEKALIRSERLAAVGTLASGIAHQFNNINQIILGNLSYCLSAPGVPSRIQERLRKALQAVKRSGGITNNLLGFTRSEKAQRERAALADLAMDTMRIVRRQFESEGIEVLFQASDAPAVSVDIGQIEQVIMNLVLNARDAMIGCQEKTISIDIERADDEICLTVRDTGNGIAPDHLPHIFDPFFTTKGEPSRANGEGAELLGGSGLGLSVAAHIIHEHGGHITVDSDRGFGSTFSIFLPRAKAERGSRETDIIAPALAGKQILVVDDEPEILHVLADAFGYEGCRVRQALNGQQALDLLQQETIDLIISDLLMPEMNGIELAECLEMLYGSGAPPMVVLSGRLSSHDIARLRDLGVCAIIHKPFDLDLLIRRCRDVFDVRSQEPLR